MSSEDVLHTSIDFVILSNSYFLLQIVENVAKVVKEGRGVLSRTHTRTFAYLGLDPGTWLAT